jgi:hypothetical protein
VTALTIHPFFDPTYYGFYWEGFRRLGLTVQVSAEGFPPPDEDLFYQPKDTLAVLVDTVEGPKRLFISADDHATVRGPELDWADRLGKVNLPVESEPHTGDQCLVALGPSFGVRSWDLRDGLSMAWLTRRAMPAELAQGQRTRLFVDQYRSRLPEQSYRPATSDPNFVFFAAWPWTKHPEVNPPRADFIRACQRQSGLRFEGGFVPRRRGNPTELDGLYALKRYAIREYLDLLGRSAVAFNNPAVHGCLGWKLGEFLALGKAIVTLPLERRLPAPLEHGVHVHVVDGSPEALDEAITRLRADATYRHSLEVAARRYYDQWLRPEVVVARLLDGWETHGR